ncbi:Fe-S protein assembly co-chaperone HscB [Marinicellulosiphila megalodicopiae]|uniref:Fe-S protein assembly co-chaperone HscB n=1 Tax=Marinicellulosiphila megalodicopiae TaxID=2724896 RepID=UPI003BB02924
MNSQNILNSSNYFELFELTEGFEIDINELNARFRFLQKAVHPDQHAMGTSKEQLLAQQLSAKTNDGYQTLKTPLLRYRYLLSLKGLEFKEHTHKDAGFLMLQMQLREDLSEIDIHANDVDAKIDAFNEQLQNMITNQTGAFKNAYLAQDYNGAYNEVVKLTFFEKLKQDVERLEDQL